MSDAELIRQGDPKKSPYVGILCYLRALLVRSAVSRSLDWSPWSGLRGRRSPDLILPDFYMWRAFEGHGVPGEKTKY